MLKNNIIIRIGLGRSLSGKILDKETKWFISKDESLNYYKSYTDKHIFISINKTKYKEITYKDLVNLEV